MPDALLGYYERELRFIRKLVWSFAEKYPEVGGRLLLEPTKCEDPHVERLIEAFAMIAARIQLRLDDDFSEVSDALLGIVYPHFLNPIPSATIVQLSLDEKQAPPPSGVLVERHSMLHARAVDGVRCRFRTTQDARLWPLEVADVEVRPAPSSGVPAEARSALRIRLRATGPAKLHELALDRLAFFLDAPAGVADELYRAFACDAVGVLVQREGSRPVVLPAASLRPMGFERNEALLPYRSESFAGYRLLQEYFAFEAKFMFVEIQGLPGRAQQPYELLELHVLLSQPPGQVRVRPERDHLRLGCAPAVNLFPHTCEPVSLTQFSVEYPVVADTRARGSYEVHSLEQVTSVRPGDARVTSYQPFYGLHHGIARDGEAAYWHLARRPSMVAGDSGTDVLLSVVSPEFRPTSLDVEVLTVGALCTNRDLPARLPFGDPAGDFEIERQPQVARARCLRKPTPAIRPPLGPGSRWRLVSHLALNHMSLADVAVAEGGTAPKQQQAALEALREILRLYDFADSPVSRQRIAGITGLATQRVLRRVGRGRDAGFARGVGVQLDLDEERFQGSGAFLFASVLERFLALYTSINSFTQLEARIRRGSELLKRWPPRAGEVQLL
jgi:type VI secretion system protein ImpG